MALILKPGLKIDKTKLSFPVVWKDKQWMKHYGIPTIHKVALHAGMTIFKCPSKGYEGGNITLHKYSLPLVTLLLCPAFVEKPMARIILFAENIRLCGSASDIYGLLDKAVPGGLERIRSESVVDYIETPFDFEGHPNDYFIWLKGCKGSESRGKIGPTSYLGKSGCKVQLKHYLKSVHMAKKGHPQPFPLIRIEPGIKGPISFGSLHALDNPFEKMMAFERNVFRSLLTGNSNYAAFLHTCFTLGFGPAFKQLSGHRKKKLQSIVSPSTPDWACAAKIWQAWPSVLTGYGMLEPHSNPADTC